MNNTTTEFLNSLCFGDQQRFHSIFWEYLKLENYPTIEAVWYNSNSWYVYINLDNWISICEAFNWVEFLVTNFETWEETFFDNYNEALEFQKSLI